MTHTSRFRPHDLLWIADAAGLAAGSELPAWASRDWLTKAPVVVRRESTVDSHMLPVGLRGLSRDERHKACVRAGDVLRCTTPEMLARPGTVTQDLADFPAIATLLDVAPLLNARGLAWGPTGSAGFSLASGIVVLRQTSDLDVVVRAPEPLDADTIDMLRILGSRASCRLDIQIDTGFGGFSFAEWIQGRQRVLLKTNAGPILTRTPWDESTGTLESSAITA